MRRDRLDGIPSHMHSLSAPRRLDAERRSRASHISHTRGTPFPHSLTRFALHARSALSAVAPLSLLTPPLSALSLYARRASRYARAAFVARSLLLLAYSPFGFLGVTSPISAVASGSLISLPGAVASGILRFLGDTIFFAFALLILRSCSATVLGADAP